jgi:hypothetical protein
MSCWALLSIYTDPPTLTLPRSFQTPLPPAQKTALPPHPSPHRFSSIYTPASHSPLWSQPSQRRAEAQVVMEMVLSPRATNSAGQVTTEPSKKGQTVGFAVGTRQTWFHLQSPPGPGAAPLLSVLIFNVGPHHCLPRQIKLCALKVHRSKECKPPPGQRRGA